MKHLRNLRVLGVLVLALFGTGCGGSTMLHVVSDESSIETQVAQHLQSHGLGVSLLEAKPGDRMVVFDLVVDKASAPLRMVIDTAHSARDRQHRDQGRVVKVILFSRVRVPTVRRTAVLRAINVHHHTVWAGCFYVNEQDGEIEAQWPINIGADYVVDSDQVADAMFRLIGSWRVLQPRVLEVIRRGTLPPGEVNSEFVAPLARFME